MYNFPDTLYPEPQKMFWDDSMCFGFPEGNTIFYSRYDGNWSDIGLWEAVNGSKRLPGAGDVVYVRHTVVADVTASVKNLFVSGTLKAVGAPFVSVLGNFQSVGVVDFSDSSIYLVLFGLNNSCGAFIKGNSSVVYAARGDQYVMNIPYYSLYISYEGVKYLTGNLYANYVGIGNSTPVSLYYPAKLNCGSFDVSIESLSTDAGFSQSTGTLIKPTQGNILFTGLINLGNSGRTTLDFYGNPNVECRGGITAANFQSSTIKSGAGLWKFTTNSQSWTGGEGSTFDAPILISGAISLTLTGSGAFYQNAFNGQINGDNAGSTFISGKLNVGYSAVTQPMQTGVLDCSSLPNVWKYNRFGGQEIKGTTYQTLEFGGSGVKKLMGNVTVLTAYSVTGTATVDLNGYTLTTP